MILLLLRYSWIKNLKIWLTENIFDRTQPKIYKPPITFLESISACQKSG